MRTLKYTTALAAAALLAAACSSDKTETPLPPCSDMPICWNVKEVVAPSGNTRALIDNERKDTDPTDPTNPDYFLPLSEACTPTEEGGYGFALGLFGDYTYKDGDKDVTVYDLFRGTRLVHSKQKGDNPHSDWNYEEAMKYWHPSAQYIFRAYYPQRLYNYTVSTSNATTLALVYPTRKLQYDLLLGYVEIDTKTNPGQMKDDVDIEMHHALAALRFNFKLGFEDSDLLTSVYLLNDEKRSYFSQGTVTYGDEKDAGSVKWLPDYNPPAAEMLYKWVPPKKFWYGCDENGDGKIEDYDKDKNGKIEGAEKEVLDADEMLAKWGIGDVVNVEKMNANPVLMRSADPISAETPGSLDEIQYGSVKLAGAYYGREESEDVPDEIASEGQLYCRNSGWLLIIPQESHGTLSVCFTTKKGGNTLYKVKLPKETEYDEQKNPISNEWKAHMRYTYTITLSRSGYSVDLSIKPWNERKHSTEIIF